MSWVPPSDASVPKTQTLYFSVDAALLAELGERLVGKAHIALAELIKNSYDADATAVEVRFSDGRLSVVDNGHGMTFEEFDGFGMWRSLLDPQESRRGVALAQSPADGVKGVGRLAVQFLGQALSRTHAQGRRRHPADGKRELAIGNQAWGGTNANPCHRATGIFDRSVRVREPLRDRTRPRPTCSLLERRRLQEARERSGKCSSPPSAARRRQ